MVLLLWATGYFVFLNLGDALDILMPPMACFRCKTRANQGFKFQGVSFFSMVKLSLKSPVKR